jgi:hypothetical protein
MYQRPVEWATAVTRQHFTTFSVFNFGTSALTQQLHGYGVKLFSSRVSYYCRLVHTNWSRSFITNYSMLCSVTTIDFLRWHGSMWSLLLMCCMLLRIHDSCSDHPFHLTRKIWRCRCCSPIHDMFSREIWISFCGLIYGTHKKFYKKLSRWKNNIVTWHLRARIMESGGIVRCVVTASKEHMTAGFRCNQHERNNRENVRNGVFYWVRPADHSGRAI